MGICQVALMAFIVATLFFRTRLQVNEQDGQFYLAGRRELCLSKGSHER